jgi:hypothetical protein
MIKNPKHTEFRFASTVTLVLLISGVEGASTPLFSKSIDVFFEFWHM